MLNEKGICLILILERVDTQKNLFASSNVIVLPLFFLLLHNPAM